MQQYMNKTKIDELVCEFERRSNHIIHTLSMCDSFTLKHNIFHVL